MESFEGLECVAHVGMLVMTAVANAAIERAVQFALFSKISLQSNQELPAFQNHMFVIAPVRRQQGHHAERCIVSDQVALVNAAVGSGATQQVLVALLKPC